MRIADNYTKSGLAIALSKLNVFTLPNPKLEQYPTDSEIAAEVLWMAGMLGDIKDRTIADFGCGTGILGIGALLLGAEKVYFVDKDTSAITTLKKNLKSLNITHGFTIMDKGIGAFSTKVHTVIQNPPFGTREEHADRVFLQKAFTLSNTVYSFHKTSTARFIDAFAGDSGFRISNRYRFDFPLKQTLMQHKKKIQRIDVTCYRLIRQ